jgi:uncharacterized protein (TIGR02391 family)
MELIQNMNGGFVLNIQQVLDARLWLAITNNLQSGDFTGAIGDAIHFLSQLIRDRSGLDGDGAPLAGEAFGGPNPKLKVNRLQTDSDRDEQQGILQLLLGIYRGIRNPRSHEKRTDSSEDAEAIILFINHLVKIIDRSRAPFDLESYLDRVFDAGFSESERYAELLVAEVPERKRWETFLAVYKNKDTRGRHWKKVAFYITALVKVLTASEVTAVCEVVSAELKTTQGDSSAQKILQIMPNELWPRYDEIARIRTESKLIGSIKDGRHSDGKCTGGVFGTWAIGLEDTFVLKDELATTLTSKIQSSDREEQDYVFEYFIRRMPDFLPNPGYRLSIALRQGLEAGDERFHKALAFLAEDVPFDPPPPAWRTVLGGAYDKFTEKQEANEGVADDHVPF